MVGTFLQRFLLLEARQLLEDPQALFQMLEFNNKQNRPNTFLPRVYVLVRETKLQKNVKCAVCQLAMEKSSTVCPWGCSGRHPRGKKTPDAPWLSLSLPRNLVLRPELNLWSDCRVAVARVQHWPAYQASAIWADAGDGTQGVRCRERGRMMRLRHSQKKKKRV